MTKSNVSNNKNELKGYKVLKNRNCNLFQSTLSLSRPFLLLYLLCSLYFLLMFSAVSFTFHSIWWQFPPFEFRSISWQGSFSSRFKPRANGINIVGQKLPTLLDASCCVRLHSLLHVVVCCYWELLHPFAHYCQHGSNNSQYCWLLRPFAHSFTGDSGVKTTLEGLLVLHYPGLSDWQSNPRFAKLHRMTRYDQTPPINPWRLWEAGTVPYCDDVPVKKKTRWSFQLNQFIYRASKIYHLCF